MGTRTAEIEYTCYNDCYGCMGGKKHKATIEVQTTSDAITFRDGFHNPETAYHFDPKTLEMFINLLKTVDYMPDQPNPKERE